MATPPPVLRTAKPDIITRIPSPDQRPGCMTAVVLFLYFAALSWVILAFSDKSGRGEWYPFHLFVQGVTAAAAAFGLWRMRKWGAYLLFGLAVVIHILYAFTGLLNIETLIVYLVMVGPALYFFSRMK